MLCGLIFWKVQKFGGKKRGRGRKSPCGEELSTGLKFCGSFLRSKFISEFFLLMQVQVVAPHGRKGYLSSFEGLPCQSALGLSATVSGL